MEATLNETALEAGQPHRVQLSRRKGWRMPANTVIVDRRSEWGNPYGVGPEQSAAVAVEKFEAFVMRRPEWIAAARQYLRGKNLACWCKLNAPCHADVWLRLANAPGPTLKELVKLWKQL